MAAKVPLASMTPAARRKRIAVLARNPGTRSSIPDKYLPSQYRAGRAQAQKIKTENATLYNPAAVLSGPDLRSAVKSEVDLQINPQVDAFSKSIRDLTSARDFSSKRLGQYMGLYNAQTGTAAANLSSGGQALVDKLAAAGSQTQGTLDQIKSDVNQEAAADTALRGPGLQDFGRANAAVDFNKAQAAGATASAEAGAAGQVSGTNTLAGTIAAVAPMRANDQQFALAGKFNQQIADMTAKRAGVEASRGDLTASTLNKMRNDQFTNLATMKGLDIKESDLQETVRKNKATEKLTGLAINQRNLDSIRDASTAHEKAVADRSYKQAQIDIKRGVDPVTGKRLPKDKKPQSAADALNAWKLDFARKHGYLPTTGPPAGTPDVRAKPADVQKAQSRYTTVSSQIDRIARQLQTGQLTVPDPNNSKKTIKVDPGSHGRNWIVSNYLDAHPTADPLYISIAADMSFDGHISKRNQDKLHARGLKVEDLEGVVPRGKFTSTKAAGKRAARKIPGFGGF